MNYSSESLRRHRGRRLRSTPTLRAMVRETSVTVNDFIYPLFVVDEPGSVRREVGSMPGVFQLSVDELKREVDEVASLKIPAVILFGLPATKDTMASGAYAEDGVVQKSVRA